MNFDKRKIFETVGNQTDNTSGDALKDKSFEVLEGEKLIFDIRSYLNQLKSQGEYYMSMVPMQIEPDEEDWDDDSFDESFSPDDVVWVHFNVDDEIVPDNGKIEYDLMIENLYLKNDQIFMDLNHVEWSDYTDICMMGMTEFSIEIHELLEGDENGFNNLYHQFLKMKKEPLNETVGNQTSNTSIQEVKNRSNIVYLDPEVINQLNNAFGNDNLNFDNMTEEQFAEFASKEHFFGEYDANFYENENIRDLNCLRYFTNLRYTSSEYFEKCKNLHTVVFPENLLYVGPNSFKDCISLKNIVFNKKLKSIEEGAFINTGCEHIIIPSTVESIYQFAFQGCQNLKSVTFAGNVKYLYDFAFADCPNLKEIVGLDLNTVNAEKIFYNTPLVQKIDYNDKFKIFDGNWSHEDEVAFLDEYFEQEYDVDLGECMNLSDEEIEKMFQENQDEDWYESLISAREEWAEDEMNPKGEYFDQSLFNERFYEWIEDIREEDISEICNTIDRITGEYRKFVRFHLHKVSIPSCKVINGDFDEVLRKSNGGYGYTYNLEISFEDGGFRVRWDNYNSDVYYLLSNYEKSEDELNDIIYDWSKSNDKQLYNQIWNSRHIEKIDPKIVREEFYIQKEINESVGNDLNQTSSQNLKDDAIEQSTELLIFQDPEVKKIFYDEIIDITDYENEIYTKEDAEIDSEDDSISDFPLYDGCWNKTGIEYFDELKYFSNLDNIPEKSFKYCTNLKSIQLPEKVKMIHEFAFENCASLTSINLASLPNLESIYDAAFANTGLVSVVIPEGVTYIGPCAFCDCKNLEYVKLPSTLKNLGEYAFANCPKLKRIDGAERWMNSLNIFNQSPIPSADKQMKLPEQVIFDGSWFANNDLEDLYLESIQEQYDEDEWEECDMNPQSENFDKDKFIEKCYKYASDDLLYSWKNAEWEINRYDKRLSCIYWNLDSCESYSSLIDAINYSVGDCELENIKIELENGCLYANGDEIYIVSECSEDSDEPYRDVQNPYSFRYIDFFTDRI